MTVLSGLGAVISVTAALAFAYLMAEIAVFDARRGDYGWAAFGAAVSGIAIALAAGIAIGAVNIGAAVGV